MTAISQADVQQPNAGTAPLLTRKVLDLAPLFAAAAYPFLLRGFHAAMDWQASGPTPGRIVGAAFFMALACGVCALGLVFALRTAGLARPTAFQIKARRLAYLCIGVPPLYVWFGVVKGFADLPVATEWAWAGVCLVGASWVVASSTADTAARASASSTPSLSPKTIGQLRVAHGIAAATILAFIAFHLANHMSALNGQDVHAAMMDVGRKVYRTPAVEVILVVLLLLQVAGGFTLAWRWSAAPADIYRVVQIASGVYLGCFILCHLNTIFIGARLVWDIPTDWDFMTSAPAGLLHSPGHLIPHYTLGVFFVLGHLLSGLRHVSLTHGLNRTMVNRAWATGLAVSGMIAVAIMAGLCGLRI